MAFSFPESSSWTSLTRISVLRFIVLLLVVIPIHSRRVRRESKEIEGIPSRLPKFCRPLLYEIELIPFVNDFVFEGREIIHLECTNATSLLTVNTKNLTVPLQDSWLREEDTNVTIQIVNETENILADMMTFHLAQEIQPGKYALGLKFNGSIIDETVGFYRSSYWDQTTQKVRWLATTQFEATDARRCFPCFDEPVYKAQFDIQIAREPHMVSISNMPLMKSEPIIGNERLPGWIMDYHARSVPMSVYLVAFVICDFPSVANMKNMGRNSSQVVTPAPITLEGLREEQELFPIRVWAPESQVEQSSLALEWGSRFLRWYENYFGIKFPLPKTDMISIPDFMAYGMENWGLITFRDVALLFDPEKATIMAKRSVIHTVSHEFAHQWFGNLVTAEWWDGIWLNEGFADYMAFLTLNKLNPEMMAEELFIMDEIFDVLELDALESSHPVNNMVTYPSEIKEIFDAITYHKGAAVIRMMSHFLTEATLRTGLSNYLSQWQYKNAVQDELWRCLTEQAQIDGTVMKNISVKEVMESWVDQTGYPVVTIKRHYSLSTISIKQNKFRYDRHAPERNLSWWVPVSYASPIYNSNFNDTSAHFWLPPGTNEPLTFEVEVGPNEWFVANIHLTGLYRVNYDVRNWKLLSHVLRTDHEIFPATNRAQMVNDAFKLARAELLSYKIAFELALYLQNDDNVLPWDAFVSGIDDLFTMLENTNTFSDIKKYIWDLMQSQYTLLGYHVPMDFKSLQTVLHRNNVLKWCGRLEWPDCVQKSLSWYGKWIQTPANNPIPLSLQVSTYCNAVKSGGMDEWEFAWDRFTKSNYPQEREALLSAMACTTSTWLLHKLLVLAIQSDRVLRKQETIQVYTEASKNPLGTRLVLEYFRSNWPKIVEYYGKEGVQAMSGVFKEIANRLHEERDLDYMIDFQKRHIQEGSLKRALDQAVEKIRDNVRWKKASFNHISAWLKNYTMRMQQTGRKYWLDIPESEQENEDDSAKDNDLDTIASLFN